VTGGPFGAAERAASAVPIRPGVPGEPPFWNRSAARFIFAPAFDVAHGPMRGEALDCGALQPRDGGPRRCGLPLGRDDLVAVEARVPGARRGGT
jgi:hypothetical protein